MIHPVLSTGYCPYGWKVPGTCATLQGFVLSRTSLRHPSLEKEKKKGKKTMAATLHTSLGDIKIELFCDRVPKTCENFLALAASNYYDNTIFHRNIKGSRPHSPSFFSRENQTLLCPAVPRYYEGPLIHNGNCSCYLPPCIDTLFWHVRKESHR